MSSAINAWKSIVSQLTGSETKSEIQQKIEKSDLTAQEKRQAESELDKIDSQVNRQGGSLAQRFVNDLIGNTEVRPAGDKSITQAIFDLASPGVSAPVDANGVGRAVAGNSMQRMGTGQTIGSSIQGSSTSALTGGGGASGSMMHPGVTNTPMTTPSSSSQSTSSPSSPPASPVAPQPMGSNFDKTTAPAGSAISQFLAANPNAQTINVGDGRVAVFNKDANGSSFGIFGQDGGKVAPPGAGLQPINTKDNHGLGTLALGAGAFLNFDANGITVDATEKVEGTALGYDDQGNISVGGASAELSEASISAANDPSISGASLKDQKVNLYPSGDPSSNDIHQGGLGDCYFDATLASLAATPAGREQIKNSIKPGKDPNTYDVTMYDPSGKPVTISVDSKVETGADGKTIAEHSLDGTSNWGTILESAWAKYNDKYHVNGTGAGFAGIDAGSGNTNVAVAALTGNHGDQSTPLQQLSSQDLDTYLKNAFGSQASGAGAGLTVGSGKEQTLPSGVKVVGPHAYSVIGYDPATQTVTVRNPWGANPDGGKNSDGSPQADDGTIKMNLHDFQACFDTTSSWQNISGHSS